MRGGLFLLIGLLFLGAAAAQESGDAAAVEARTDEVSRQIRCVVCKNQSIAESDAPLAKDLQRLVRERIEAGDSNEEAKEYIVARYGEFVLLKPRMSLRNLGLWTGPFLVLAAGLAAAVFFVRSRRPEGAAPQGLSDEERAELERLRG